MSDVKVKKIFLWSVPRTLSTAFLRGMSTLDGCKALHQPYMFPHFNERSVYPLNIPETISTDYEEAKKYLNGDFEGYKIVFIKEMAKNLGSRDLMTFIPEDYIHTFLIRNPLKTMKSFLQMEKTVMPELKKLATEKELKRLGERGKFNLELDVVEDEQSFKYLKNIYQLVTNSYRQNSIIIDADDLQRNPCGTLKAYCKEVGIQYQDSMVNWGPVTPEQSQIWEEALSVSPVVRLSLLGAIDGVELIQSEPKTVTMEDIDEKYRFIVEKNMSIYLKLHERRILPLEL